MTSRPGFILLYSILLVLALSVAAAGMMALAAREGLIARAHVRRVEARVSAESAARWAAATWSSDPGELAEGEALELDPQVVGAGEAEALAASVTITRLDPFLYVVRAEAAWGEEVAGRPTGGASRAALLLRVLDSSLALGSFPAAAAADSLVVVSGGGSVTGWNACTGTGGPFPGIVAPAVDVRDGVVDGAPAIEQVPPPASAPGDPLDPAVVAVIKDVAPGGSGSPRPSAAAGECVAELWNWGAIFPAHPCHGLLPLIAAERGLTVQGGEGRGIIVGSGDLILEGPFAFEGLILATGRLRIGPEVRIRGAVRAARIEVDGGDVLLDRCAMSGVLDAAAFRTTLRPGSRWWIPAF